MRRIFFLILGASALTSAQATDGTINFTGSVTGTTCNITVNGSAAPAAATVRLAPAPQNELNAAGATSTPTPFEMALTGCTSTGRVSAHFENGNGVDFLGRVINTGTATNVDLQLYDNMAGTGAAIRAGYGDARTTVQIAGGNATLKYGVQYVATGQATPGTVVGAVTYRIVYE